MSYQTLSRNVQMQKVDKDAMTITNIYPYTLASNIIIEGKSLQELLDEKANIESPTLTGTPKTTTPTGTITTQIANVQFVQDEVERKLEASDALRFKGTLGVGGTIEELPSTHSVGDTYKVITAGTYAGKKCEIGDMIICITNRASGESLDSDWTVVQNNIDGAVIGPTSSVSNNVAVFNGATGKLIKDSGFVLEKSVPADAKLTDTTYENATTTVAGLMSTTDKIKLDGIVDEIAISTTQPTENTKMWINLNGDTFLYPEEKFNVHSYTSEFVTDTRLLDHNEYRINYSITSCSIKIPAVSGDSYKSRLIVKTGSTISFSYEDLSGYGVYFVGDDCNDGILSMQSNKIYFIDFLFIGLKILATVKKISL